MSTFKIARVSQLLVPVFMSWAIFFGTTASASDPGAPAVSIATGSCDSLIMSADDHTAECDARLASVTLRDGTVMFIFTANLIPIAFSGNGKRLGKGINGTGKLPLNFIMGGEGGSKGSFKAEGSCMFGDPFRGKAMTVCMAQTQGGPFLAVFETDGKSPETQLSK